MTDKTKLNLVLKGKPMTDPKLDKAAETFVKIRDARAALKKQYETEDAGLKAQQDVLSNFFMETLQTLGKDVESVRTKYGTVYKYIEIKPSCGDWNAFYAWIAEHEAFDALERRVKKSFVTTYMEDNKGKLPPGINVLKEYAVKVLRS